jgi:uncharacterized protein YabE (DUF348 family)
MTQIWLVEAGSSYALTAQGPTPLALAAQAGLIFSAADRFLLDGQPIPAEQVLPASGTHTLQLVRARLVTLLTPDGETTFQTTAPTVGQALAETGLQLYRADYIAPLPETPLTDALTITYRPARDYIIRVDNLAIPVKSAAGTVGQILASAGIPLLGLDQSRPAESDPAPADGVIEIVRVQETVTVAQKSLPFSTKYQPAADLPIGSETLIQPGEPGLSLTTERVRYENGVEVARTTEAEVVVRQPVEQIMGRGSQVTVQQLDMAGGQVQYWRAVQMYATSYSPCRSGTSKCSYGTASGVPVRHGVVAMTRDLFYALGGSQVYVPGYGVGVIGDVGGGFPDGRLWIDLGYSDEDWQTWSGWVTVYFLGPAPAAIPAALQ